MMFASVSPMSARHLPQLALAYQDPPADDEYETVEGLDQQTTKLKREYEAQVEQKVASDYAHIVWAYGVIWSLFAIYGVTLLVRSIRQQRDLAALQSELKRRG